MAEAHAWLGRIFDPDAPADKALRTAYEDGRLQELSAWLAEKYNYELPPEEMLRCSAERLERHLTAAVEDRLPAGNAEDGAGPGAATARHRLERPPAGDGPPPQQRRPARLRPDRSQGRVQARRDADFRADVDFGRRAGDRPDLPHGAARRGLRRLDLERSRRRFTRTPNRPARSPPSSRRPSRARKWTTSRSRSATASSASAATIPAPAAAGRSSSSAA